MNNPLSAITDATKIEHKRNYVLKCSNAMTDDKKDWCIFVNDDKMMIIFNVPKKEIDISLLHYNNRLAKLQKVVYSAKECKTVDVVFNE